MYHNRTPYLGLLILLHSFAATGITCRRRRRTTQTGTKRKAISSHRLFAHSVVQLSSFFGTRACTPRGLIAIIINIIVVTNYVSFWVFVLSFLVPLFRVLGRHFPSCNL
jgi:hypothetical protein